VNPLQAASLEDVQTLPDEREVQIDQVGVSDLRYPILVVDRTGFSQRTISTVEMDVDLNADVRGTHMSRFVEVLDAHAGEISVATVPKVAVAIRDRLDSECARVAFRFPYFLERSAPISELSSLTEFFGELRASTRGNVTISEVGVRVALTSLCPCSKEISDYGAHSQRGYVDMSVRCADGAQVWLEDLIEVGEECGSAPVRPLLKRVDERYLTMQAYDNPAFVEDIVRDAAVALRDDRRVAAFRIQATNQESIHHHSAVARVRWERPR
jgi:GTP cyclohydrolase I